MRAVIFEPNSDISTNPTLVNLVRRLAADGIPVDIYQPGHGDFLPFQTDSRNVTSHKYYYPEPLLRSFDFRGLRFTGYHTLKRLAHPFQMRRTLKRIRQYAPETVILAIDPHGAVEAHRYHRRTGIPFAYFSFEIFFRDEAQTFNDIRIKALEVEASRAASLLVLQDPHRGRLFAGENGLKDAPMFYMPVAPAAGPEVRKTEFLREKFRIPGDRTIVIHAGSFYTWTFAEDLIKSARHWPEEFVLVIHTRSRPDAAVRRLMDSGNAENIIFSTEPLGDAEYHEMLASADIGLVLYNPTYSDLNVGKNIETVGLASGKFSYYMKCGIPTISVKQDSIGENLEGYRFGLNIEDFGAMPDALMAIKRQYSDLSLDARKLFNERLSFDLYYPELRKRLEGLLKGTEA